MKVPPRAVDNARDSFDEHLSDMFHGSASELSHQMFHSSSSLTGMFVECIDDTELCIMAHPDENQGKPSSAATENPLHNYVAWSDSSNHESSSAALPDPEADDDRSIEILSKPLEKQMSISSNVDDRKDVNEELLSFKLRDSAANKQNDDDNPNFIHHAMHEYLTVMKRDNQEEMTDAKWNHRHSYPMVINPTNVEAFYSLRSTSRFDDKAHAATLLEDRLAAKESSLLMNNPESASIHWLSARNNVQPASIFPIHTIIDESPTTVADGRPYMTSNSTLNTSSLFANSLPAAGVLEDSFSQNMTGELSSVPFLSNSALVPILDQNSQSSSSWPGVPLQLGQNDATLQNLCGATGINSTIELSVDSPSKGTRSPVTGFPNVVSSPDRSYAATTTTSMGGVEDSIEFRAASERLALSMQRTMSSRLNMRKQGGIIRELPGAPSPWTLFPSRPTSVVVGDRNLSAMVSSLPADQASRSNSPNAT